MEKKFYEIPELKVVDLEGEMLLADSEQEPGEGNVDLDGDPQGGEGEAKRIFGWD